MCRCSDLAYSTWAPFYVHPPIPDLVRRVDRLCSCDAGNCVVHPRLSFSMEGTVLTEEVRPMSQDAVGGMSNIDWRLVGKCLLFFEIPS